MNMFFSREYNSNEGSLGNKENKEGVENLLVDIFSSCKFS